MLNPEQVKLLQTAVRAAGLRDRGQYYLVLGQYRQANRSPVTSCKQLNNYQAEDLLGICESYGWRHPGKPADYYRLKMVGASRVATGAQIGAIGKLAGDLGWNELQLGGMIKRMTGGRKTCVVELSPAEAYRLIEAMKAMFARQTGVDHYDNLTEVERQVTDGPKTKVG